MSDLWAQRVRRLCLAFNRDPGEAPTLTFRGLWDLDGHGWRIHFGPDHGRASMPIPGLSELGDGDEHLAMAFIEASLNLPPMSVDHAQD